MFRLGSYAVGSRTLSAAVVAVGGFWARRGKSWSQASRRINESLDVDAALRNVVKKLRRKLGDDAANPRYIVAERRVGSRMVAAGTGQRANDGAELSITESPEQSE